jgi:hypothetical protein
MKALNSRVGWGLILIGGGVFLLLQALEIFAFGQALLWAIVFGAASVALWIALAGGRGKPWAAFLGYFVAVAATVIALDESHLLLISRLSGQTMLGALGLGFWALYIADHKRRWAVLTGGGLLSTAAATTLDELFRRAGDIPAGVFFLGMGVTFALLYLLPTGREERPTWPLYAALGLILIGFLIIASSTSIVSFLSAGALIAAGLYVIWRNRSATKAEEGKQVEAR